MIPATAPIGASITLLGVGLSNASEVKFFNGAVAVTYTVINDSQINVTVPVGAVDGDIEVTTPGGTDTIAFDVDEPIPAPTITNIAPLSGLVSSFVTLTGTGFTSATQVLLRQPIVAFTKR